MGGTRDRPLVVGANHRSSSMRLRDRLFVEESAVPAFLARLREAGIEQALVLSTGIRIEVHAIHGDHDAAAPTILDAMADHAGVARADLDDQTYIHSDHLAVRHIFAVASALDSLTVGDALILSQVSDSHRLARQEGMSGPDLDGIIEAAQQVAERVQGETAVSRRAVSIASAAVQVARDLHGDLDRRSALLVGAGELGEVVTRDLMKAGLGGLTVTHPRETRAERLSRAFDCHRTPFDTLADALAGADIVITALGGRRRIVDRDLIRAALKKRRRKPMFLIDTAVPGDVEPSVHEEDGAFVYDADDLERVAMEGMTSREAEAADAWRIVDEEVAAFVAGWQQDLDDPAPASLRRHLEGLRAAALAEANGDAVEATRLLTERLLDGPSAALERPEDRQKILDAINTLFGGGGEPREKT